MYEKLEHLDPSDDRPWGPPNSPNASVSYIVMSFARSTELSLAAQWVKENQLSP